MSEAIARSAADPLHFRIQGMDCGSCALTIENSIRQLPGVKSVTVSFTTESMDVEGAVTTGQVERRLRELGYRLASGEKPQPLTAAPGHRGVAGFLRFLWSQPRLRIAVVVGAVVAAASIAFASEPAGTMAARALNVVFALAVVVVGAPVFIKGFRAAIFARRITIDLLMAIATVGALAIGEGGEAATVILLFTLGEALEAYSAERARDSLRSLMSLQPQEATVLREHREDHHDHAAHDDHDHAIAACAGDHDHDHDDDHAGEAHYHQAVVPVSEVAVDDVVLVRPGQRIPVDGAVLRGNSSVNQAAVTGESIPVPKAIGDEVMAGTVNGEGALEIRVTRPAGDSTIAHIARLVEQAQSQRSPAERFIDRFARYYTPAVVALAVLVVAVPVLGFGQPLLDGADGTHGWLYRALALLIVACPCALVISIPVTMVSGLTRLANLGVLVKGGAQLDALAGIQAVAFDKTGTLTRGRPSVTTVAGAECRHEPIEAECERCDDVVAVAASVESASEHPVAHAIVSEASHRRLQHRYQPARAVTAHAGRGVSGQTEDGHKIAVGSDALFTAGLDGRGELAGRAREAQEAGHTVMFVGREDKVIGYIGVQDEIRAGSRAALEELHGVSPAVKTVMLTGDNPQVAARVAERIGFIDDVRAGLLPEDKLAAVEELRRRYGRVAMVGDGINDAPALARADVGIAMGQSGTAQAMETADVVLMQDDLSHVPMALRIARRAQLFTRQNIALSLTLKLAFLVLAIPGITTLWMAVIADVGATMLVTLNGMRLLREK